MQSLLRSGSVSFSSANPLRIPRPKIDKLACQAQGVGILAKGEITLYDAYRTFLIIKLFVLARRRNQFDFKPLLFKHLVSISQICRFDKGFLKISCFSGQNCASFFESFGLFCFFA
jgi:hypothetical protein